jgi:hypothetical protein
VYPHSGWSPYSYEQVWGYDERKRASPLQAAQPEQSVIEPEDDSEERARIEAERARREAAERAERERREAARLRALEEQRRRKEWYLAHAPDGARAKILEEERRRAEYGEPAYVQDEGSVAAVEEPQEEESAPVKYYDDEEEAEPVRMSTASSCGDKVMCGDDEAAKALGVRNGRVLIADEKKKTMDGLERSDGARGVGNFENALMSVAGLIPPQPTNIQKKGHK